MAKRATRSDVHRAVLVLLALAYVVVMVSQFAPSPPVSSIASTTALRAESQAAPTPAAVAETPAPMAAAPTTAPTKAPTPVAAAPTKAPSTILKGRRTMVFVVNYVDSKRCGETLESLFKEAAAPELLRVSVHDQIHLEKGDLPCVEAYCQRVGERECRRSQIIATSVDADEAKGPTVARHITEKALGDEEFCLGLDSHLVFVPSWDEKIVQNWEATGNDKAILTVYPKSIEFMTNHAKDNQMGLMCYARIEQPDPDTMIQYQAVHWLPKDNTTKPRLMSQFAGGFNFGPCQAYRDVPNDPYTPVLFYGEEYIRAARLWTWGYDMYAPSVDVLYHWFETRQKIWDEDWSKRAVMMARSKKRVRAILGLPTSNQDFDHTDMDKYGLGTKRTFAQWKKFSGIDPLTPWTDKTRLQFNNCGELEYVPYNDK